MNYQERKQWLERYRVCIDRIEELREIQRAARSNAEKVTPGSGGDIQQSGNDSKVERAIITIRSAEREIEALEDEIPYGRMATTKEIAEIAYNLYKCPSYLTGQIITADGGWT